MNLKTWLVTGNSLATSSALQLGGEKVDQKFKIIFSPCFLILETQLAYVGSGPTCPQASVFSTVFCLDSSPTTDL